MGRVLAILILFLSYTLGSASNLTFVSTIQYQKTDKNLLLQGENNTFAIENQWTVLSCARSCKHNANCSAFVFRYNGDYDNCILISSNYNVSYADYTFMIEDDSTYTNELCASSSSWRRRINGEIDFYRNWTEYKEGFGDRCGEFWLGNDKLHELTKDGEYRLRIELEDNDGVIAAVEYATFIVGDEDSKYRLTVGGFNGTKPPGDSLAYHNGMRFTTYDADNDRRRQENCASVYNGGWWYRGCHASNLNGKYGSVDYGEGVNWKTWKGHYYSMSVSRMMIKRK